MRKPALYEPAPWFVAATETNPRYTFSMVGGRHVVLSFLGSSTLPAAQRLLASLTPHRARFRDDQIVFFGVTVDPRDQGSAVMKDSSGLRFFFDLDRAVSRLYGVTPEAEEANPRYQPTTFVLDPNLRVLAVLPLGDGEGHIAEVLALLAALPPVGPIEAAKPQAPVLLLPRIFEPDFCRRLIATYDADGGRDSGFMRDIGGKTRLIVDHSHKRRDDSIVTDEGLIGEIRDRIWRRLVPEVRKAFAFEATRMERYLVARYDSESGGHFRPHRDNTTKGTAHRRFACTINLNAEDYTGGDLRFPEYGPQSYRAPTGGAVVFSCSLLHEALPVTRGARYAFLPFLYDEAAAQLRLENLRYLDRPAS